MTAINIIKKPDCVHIVTDGAFYTADGILTHVSAKCFALPTLDMALVIRGRCDIMPLLLIELQKRCTEFDSAIDEVAGALHAVTTFASVGLTDVIHAGSFDPQFELWMVGYSASRDTFETYVLPTHDRHPGLLAWQVGKIEGSICAPVPTAEAVRAAGVTDPIEIETFDPEIDSLRLLEIQRLVPSAFDMRYPDRRGSIVGGLGMLVTITRDGIISEKVLKRWPDRIGALIEPRSMMARRAIQAGNA